MITQPLQTRADETLRTACRAGGVSNSAAAGPGVLRDQNLAVDLHGGASRVRADRLDDALE